MIFSGRSELTTSEASDADADVGAFACLINRSSSSCCARGRAGGAGRDMGAGRRVVAVQENVRRGVERRDVRVRRVR